MLHIKTNIVDESPTKYISISVNRGSIIHAANAGIETVAISFNRVDLPSGILMFFEFWLRRIFLSKTRFGLNNGRNEEQFIKNK